MTDRRYPLPPLMAAADIPSMVALRRIFPMNGTTYRQVLDQGITEVQADRWAVKLGLHPSEVWRDFGLVECTADDCTMLFAPVRAGHRYCSDRCRERVRMRELYRSDPEWAAAKRTARRRFYEDCAEYEKARERRRYHSRRNTQEVAA